MSDQEIRNEVRKLLFDNMVKGYSKSTKINYRYIKRSPDRDHLQFFQDTCFHVFMLNALGEFKLAKDHLISLFSMQEKDGFCGHSIYWNKALPDKITDIFKSKPSLGWNIFRTHSSALLHPPFAAQAVLTIYKSDRDLDFLRRIYPKLKNYYSWLEENRDFEKEGLLSIISPVESGMDWKPSFDEVVGFRHRKAKWNLSYKLGMVNFKNFIHGYDLKTIYKKNYFIVKEAGFNTVYAQNLRSMISLGKILNDPEVKKYKILSEKVLSSIEKYMYDAEDAAFYDIYGKNNKKIKVFTPTIFFPLILEGLPDELVREVINRHFHNKEEFSLNYPLPSVAKNDPSFNPTESRFKWRGQTHIIFNWYLYNFLQSRGYNEESKILIESMKSLYVKSGFREYYNPVTGDGLGAINTTQTGLIIDMMKK